MGQKINPIGLRLALNKNWCSRWFARKDNFGTWLHEDRKVRTFIKKNYNQAAISNILIERYFNRVRTTIFAARPGVLLGKKGGKDAEIDRLRDDVSKLLDKGQELIVDVIEVKQPETNAQLVAENVAAQLERRIGFRRAMNGTRLSRFVHVVAHVSASFFFFPRGIHSFLWLSNNNLAIATSAALNTGCEDLLERLFSALQSGSRVLGSTW